MIFLQGNSVKEEKGCSKGVNEMIKTHSSLMHFKSTNFSFAVLLFCSFNHQHCIQLHALRRTEGLLSTGYIILLLVTMFSRVLSCTDAH